jgi:hypothetical protein
MTSAAAVIVGFATLYVQCGGGGAGEDDGKALPPSECHELCDKYDSVDCAGFDFSECEATCRQTQERAPCGAEFEAQVDCVVSLQTNDFTCASGRPEETKCKSTAETLLACQLKDVSPLPFCAKYCQAVAALNCSGADTLNACTDRCALSSSRFPACDEELEAWSKCMADQSDALACNSVSGVEFNGDCDNQLLNYSNCMKE